MFAAGQSHLQESIENLNTKSDDQVVSAIFILDIDECALGESVHGCEGSCVNYPGGYYCLCPETRQLASSQITVYPEQIPESECQGFPFTHLGLYTCSNDDYGPQECLCQESGTGIYKLVAGTGGCISK